MTKELVTIATQEGGILILGAIEVSPIETTMSIAEAGKQKILASPAQPLPPGLAWQTEC